MLHPENPVYDYKTLKQKDIEVVLPTTPDEPIRLRVHGEIINIEANRHGNVWLAEYPDFVPYTDDYPDADTFAQRFRQDYNQRLGMVRKNGLKDRRFGYDLDRFSDELSEESHYVIQCAKSGPSNQFSHYRLYLREFGVRQSLNHPYRSLPLDRERFSYVQNDTLRILYDGHVIGHHDKTDTPDAYVDVAWQDVNAAREIALDQIDKYGDNVHRAHDVLDTILALKPKRKPKRP